MRRRVTGVPMELVARVQNVAEVNFVFDKSSGRLAMIEMFADSELDPCEIHFADYRDEGGRQFPHKLEVRHGESIFADITLQKVNLASAKQEDKK